MHFLVQGAAHRHVHFLETAADRQHRNAFGNRLWDEVERGQIAGRIMQIALITGLIGVMMRLDVARRTRQKQSVQLIQQRIQIQTRSDGRNQQWLRTRTVQNGADVFFTHGLEWMRADHSAVCGDSDENHARVLRGLIEPLP